jgi:hypothetical protein
MQDEPTISPQDQARERAYWAEQDRIEDAAEAQVAEYLESLECLEDEDHF